MKKTFPPLYQQSSTNKTKYWNIFVEGSPVKHEPAKIVVEHGYKDGKIQTDIEEITVGLNLGRANETTPYQQACNEAQSKYNKKIDKGYKEESKENEVSDIILPMLATKFVERKHDIVYPAFQQPKLNGVRCVVKLKDGKPSYQSRLGKYWTSLSHLDKDVLHYLKAGLVLDGEIYIHSLSLQDIGSLIKKERLSLDDSQCEYKTSDLEYWTYDCITKDKSDIFETRLYKLLDVAKEHYNIEATDNGNAKTGTGMVQILATHGIGSEEEIDIHHKNFLAEGYEGSMIRNNVPYQINKRTKDLQKLKPSMDDEFEIVGGKEGTGRFKGCCTFRCKTKEGIEFDVTPIGTISQKKQYMKDIKSLTGKMLTCRYQEITNNGTPFHARGIAVRNYE